MTAIPNIYILDEKETPVGVLNPELPNGCPFFEDTLTERLEHGYLTFEFEVPANHPTAAYLKSGGFIVYPNVGYEAYHPYLLRIMETTETNKDGEYRKKVYCENAAVADLLGNIVRPATLSSYTLEQAISYVLSGTDWIVGETEYAGTKDIKFDDYMTSLEALHQVLDAFGAEVDFFVLFDGLKVVQKTVSGLIKKGDDIMKPFVYGLDLTEVERVEDYTNLVTALIGVGKVNNADITFASYTPTGLDTTKYEKPAGADWVGSLEALQRWSKNGKHIFGIYRDDNITNAVELFNNCLAALDKYSKPRLTYKVGVVLLANMTGYEAHRVRLGDTVIVKDTTFQPELILEARIIEMKRSLTDPTRDEVTLGEFIPILGSANKTIQDLRKKLDESVKTVMGTGLHIIANAPKPLEDGQYMNYDHSLTIQVTENVHIGHVSVYCQSSGQTGTVELRLSDDTVVERRTFTNLVAGENRLNLDFLLKKDVGTYKLYGDFSGNTYVTTQGVQFPYDSGTFKVTATSSPGGYWYHFYNISIGGSGVTGGLGRQLNVGDANNYLGTIQALDGNGEATFVVDKDQVTISKLVAGEIVSPNVVNVSTVDNVVYYVNPSTGDDDNDGSSSSPLKTVKAVINKIPRVFDGTIEIQIQGNLTEDIDIMGFLGSGTLKLWFNNWTYTGTITIRSVKARVDINDAIINYADGETRAPIQCYQCDYVFVNNCKIRGNGQAGGTSSCIQVYDSSFAYINNSELYNATNSLVRANYGGKAIIVNVKGSGAPIGLKAEYGGIIGIGGTPIPDCSTDYDATSGGQIVLPPGWNPGNTANYNAGTPSSAPTPPKKGSWGSASGNSWRTRYNTWRNDGTVRQGQWDGWGLHTGIWLFSSSLSTTLTGKTIQKMRVKLTRLKDGGNAYTPVYIRWHGYTSLPGSAPQVSNEYIVATFGRGDTKEIVLPSSFYSYFSNGTAKGIAIYIGNGTNTYYAVFDDTAWIYVDYV